MINRRLRVVILNYNKANMTKECVRHVLAQNYDGQLDVVVVDNHSTETVFNKLKQLLPAKVKIVRAERNLGYAAGNNLGARLELLPLSEYIMVLNNDVILIDEDTCEKLVRALENDSFRVACSPLVDTVGTGIPQMLRFRLGGFQTFLPFLSRQAGGFEDFHV